MQPWFIICHNSVGLLGSLRVVSPWWSPHCQSGHLPSLFLPPPTFPHCFLSLCFSLSGGLRVPRGQAPAHRPDQASAVVTLADVPLATASQVAQARVRVGGDDPWHGFQEVWFIGSCYHSNLPLRVTLRQGPEAPWVPTSQSLRDGT